MGKIENIKDQFDFIKYCMSRRTDERFKKIVYSIGDDYSLVNMEKHGELQTERPIYYIAPDASGSGFFSDFLRSLAYFYYADNFDLIPVIKYPQGFCYSENHEVLGTTNPYEYYFTQPGKYDLKIIDNAKCIVKARKENAALVGQLNPSGHGYDYSSEYLDVLGNMVSKYIKFNEETDVYLRKAIDRVISQNDRDRVLGVHVRGTDFKRNYKNHPMLITTEEYLKETKKVYSDNGYNRVFLATDDTYALEIFKKEFGDNLIYFEDVIRSDGNETVMKSVNSRENHHYLLGLEVLRDAYTLGLCSGLVAGLSQVSTAARVLNRSSYCNSRYIDEDIIFKGINKAGEICK